MRFFIYLQYDGTNYHGWQTQPDAVSVQETIEKKLSMLLRRELFIVGAGRTDTGVHARLMVAHFDDPTLTLPREGVEKIETASVERSSQQNTIQKSPSPGRAGVGSLKDLTFKLNGVLPPDISILKIVPVRADAHARFSPTYRTYRYYVTTRKDIYRRLYACRLYWDLDIELMNQAAAKLLEYDDFTSFAKLHTDVKTNICHVTCAEWTADGQGYVFKITADRFLRNMVRAIVGTLMQVGRHKLTVEQFCRIIEGKDRCIAGDSAPACGLFLEEIGYPDEIFRI